MLFFLRHKLSLQGLLDLIHLISYICPAPNRCYSTIYQIKKFFVQKLGTAAESPNVVKTCKRCLQKVGARSKRCGRNARCKRAGVFEYYLFDIRSQLQVLLQGTVVPLDFGIFGSSLYIMVYIKTKNKNKKQGTKNKSKTNKQGELQATHVGLFSSSGLRPDELFPWRCVSRRNHIFSLNSEPIPF